MDLTQQAKLYAGYCDKLGMSLGGVSLGYVITQLQTRIAELEIDAQKNLEMAMRYHKQSDEWRGKCQKKHGKDPWHNVDDTNRITQLQAEIEELKKADKDHLSAKRGLEQRYNRLRAEKRKYENALKEIITESGKVDITNWPAQQQICQAIAQQALKGNDNGQINPKTS